MTNKKVIAVFDFDGTLTKKDTLFDFISFYKGKKALIWGLCKLSPTLISYKLGLLKNNVAKEKLFSFFFKDESIDRFNNKAIEYINRIEEIYQTDSKEMLQYHLENKHEVIVISASITNWIKPWANKTNIYNVFATDIEIKDGYITGRFKGENCYGQEKVNRLLEKYPNRSDYTLYVYGDSDGDKALLAIADFPTLYKR